MANLKTKIPCYVVQNNEFPTLFSKVSKHGWDNNNAVIDCHFTPAFDGREWNFNFESYGPFLIYGTVEFIKQCARNLYLHHFVYNEEEQLSMKNLGYKLGDLSLNRIGGGIKVEAMTKIFESGNIAEFFIRPDCVDKAFPANVYNQETWSGMVKSTSLAGDIDCWVTDPKPNIKDEWRFWIIDGQISSSSQYRKDGELVSIPVTDFSWPEIEVFVEKAVTLLDSKLPCYVMDVCEYGTGAAGEEGLKVVELNPINSSGFYGDANIPKILTDWMASMTKRHSQTVALERVRAIRAEMDEINKLDILTVEVTKGDSATLLTDKERESLRFTGLSTFAMLEQVAQCFIFKDVIPESVQVCPSCESHNVQEEILVDNFQYGLGDDKIELSASVPVISCKDCGEKFTDYRADEIKDLMIKNILPKKLSS
jgi:YgiT-type zinc finger domain-containing protein